jgi:hypothetical protein
MSRFRDIKILLIIAIASSSRTNAKIPEKTGLTKAPSNPRHFDVQLTNNDYLFYDNIDDRCPNWFKEGLAASATEIKLKINQFYRTNKEVEYPARPYIAITTRTARFSHERDDITDRSLVFHVKKIENRTDEKTLLDRIKTNRDKILSVCLDKCNKIINNLKERRNEDFESNFRMADLERLVIHGFPENEKNNREIFDKMMQVQEDLAAEGSLIFNLIDNYLDSKDVLEGTTTEIYTKLHDFKQDTK